MQFLTSPVRTILGLLGVIVGGLILLTAIAHSAHGQAILGGSLAALMLLLAVRVPIRFVLGLAVLVFVVVGVTSLVTELMSSGVVALVLVICGLVALAYALRWTHLARSGWHGPPRRRSRNRLPHWRSQSFRGARRRVRW